jgi:hypothetical protein
MSGSNEYYWWLEGLVGWVTNAEWSPRYVGAPAAQVSKLNDLLLRAIDA